MLVSDCWFCVLEDGGCYEVRWGEFWFWCYVSYIWLVMVGGLSRVFDGWRLMVIFGKSFEIGVVNGIWEFLWVVILELVVC